MTINEVNITPVKPIDGLVAFASCVIDGQIYVGSIGVHKLLDGSGYRITYPTKKIGSRQLNFFHPVTKETGRLIEQAIVAKCVELFERSDEQYDRHNKVTHTNL
jgi:DNA-binding cell septation regulator SpoVG